MTTYYLAEALHYGQAALSAYGIVNSLISIKKLHEWEPQTKQAAQYSATAEYQLQKTRTTQASALLGVVASFGVSIALATSWEKCPWAVRLLASPLLAGGLKVMYTYVSDFWEKSQKVPVAAGYNEAIRRTEAVLWTTQILEYSWWISSLLAGIVQYR